MVTGSRVYSKIGFHISTINIDVQFDTSRIRGAAAELNVTLNPVSEDDHVPKVERYSRTIKERSGYIPTTFKLKEMPGRLTMELVMGYVL